MSPRAYRLGLAAVLALHALLLLLLAWLTPWTTDEPNYFKAGVALREHLRWDLLPTVLHGPLAFYPNQLCAWAHADLPWQDARFLARLGMLPYALLTTLLLAGLARAVAGPRVALAAALLHVLNPIALAHGALITADSALACGSLLTLCAFWHYLQQPGLRRALGVGLALGLALATKYLALHLLPILGLMGLWQAARGRLPLRALFGHGTALLLLALATLHACYLFQPGGYALLAPGPDPDPFSPTAGPLSAPFRALHGKPLAAWLLGLLPAPFARGIDFQLQASASPAPTVFAGQIGPGFWLYHVTALATKLPLGWLALLGVGLVLRAPRWPQGCALLLCLAIGIPLVHLSGFTPLQIGVRYLLPILPLLALCGGRGLAGLCAQPRGRWFALVLVGLSTAFVVAHFPRLLGAFHALAPRPYLLFADSNVAWHSQTVPDPDLARLQARHPQSQRVRAGHGPRLGPVHAYALDLSPPDPADPHRVKHWLRAQTPIARIGAWYAFQISAADLRGTDAAIALLGAGRVQEALQALGDAPAAELREACALAAAGQTASPRFAELAFVLQRPDLVRASELPLVLQLRAAFELGEPDRLVKLAEAAQAARALTFDEAIYFALGLLGTGRHDAVLAALDRAAPAAGAAGHDAYRSLRRQLERELAGVRDVLRAGAGR